MKRVIVLIWAIFAGACAPTKLTKVDDSSPYQLTVSPAIGAALLKGETLRFGPKIDKLGTTENLEHCGQICHTYKVCTPDGCEYERICVDNPNCNDHKP